MVAGINRDSANIFKNTHSELSRIHSPSSGASESDMREMSRKSAAAVTEIQRDEVEYQIDDMMDDQEKDWREENFERAFSTFQ